MSVLIKKQKDILCITTEYWCVFDKLFAITQSIKENDYKSYRNIINKENNIGNIYQTNILDNIIEYIQHVALELKFKSYIKEEKTTKTHSIPSIISKLDISLKQKIEQKITELEKIENKNLSLILKNYSKNKFNLNRQGTGAINQTDYHFLDLILENIKFESININIGTNDYKKFNNLKKILIALKNKNSSKDIFHDFKRKNIDIAIYHLGIYSIEIMLKLILKDINKTEKYNEVHELFNLYNNLFKYSITEYPNKSKDFKEKINLKNRLVENFMKNNNNSYLESRYFKEYNKKTNKKEISEIYDILFLLANIMNNYFEEESLNCYTKIMRKN